MRAHASLAWLCSNSNIGHAGVERAGQPDAVREVRRFLVLQGSGQAKCWRLFEFVPKKPMQTSPDLPLMEACCRNYRFLSRPISVRFTASATECWCHRNTLAAA